MPFSGLIRERETGLDSSLDQAANSLAKLGKIGGVLMQNYCD